MCPFLEVRQAIKQKDRQNRASKAIRDKKIKRLVMIGVIVAAAVGIGLAIASSKALSGAGVSASAIDGIQCNNVEQLVSHIHAHLDIFINGQPYTIPSQIGITDKCFYWLHTHDESGVIHIESPVAKDYTIGQFFNIWNQKFSNTQILDNIVNGKNTLNVYVNGNKVNAAVNYRDIKLKAHDEIAIVYGKPPSTIPSKYNFAKAE
ncbi:MAG TPA: hypothetical protein VIW25_13210 [Nitrososphaeraceae archaeon]